MKITYADRMFWFSNRSPSWARDPKLRVPSIHECINGHADMNSVPGEPYNTISLLKMKMRRMSASEALSSTLYAEFVAPSVNSNRRVRFCRKWLNRIRK